MSFLVADFGISSSFVFKDIALEHRVIIPGENFAFADRIDLSIYGMPEFESGNGVNDLRVQVNGRDITTAVCNGFIGQLTALPNFTATYANAMSQWLDYRAALESSYLARRRTGCGAAVGPKKPC